MEDFHKKLDMPSPSGGFTARSRMRFVFVLRTPHKQAAAAVEGVMDRLLDTFAPPEIDSLANDNGDWINMTLPELKDELRARLTGSDQATNESLALAGSQSNIPDFSLDYAGYAIDRPVFKAAASVLWFAVPTRVFAQRRDALIPLSVEIAAELGCSTGYVSIAMDGGQREMQARAERFRGIDISDPGAVVRDIEDKLPGVYWRTYLGPTLLTSMGGYQSLQALGLETAQLAADRAGGLWIQLGEPRLGDVNRKENMADYEALAGHAHKLGLLHVPKRVTYFDETGSLSDAEAQEQWHTRFV